MAQKNEWAKEKAREGGWKNVVVHDSNDLEHWLELARDVDAWISHETKQIPSGISSLQSHWVALRAIGAHELVPAVFTASRETELQGVKQLLSREPDSLFIRTPGLSDGIDFLAAWEAQESELFRNGDPAVEPQYLSLLQDGVFVFNHEDWRQLAQSEGPLLLVASPSLQLSSTDIASAVQSGHYVIVCGPRGIVPADKGVQLRGVQQYELAKALETSGYSEAKANSFAKSCAGNTTILKRRIAAHPDTVLPAWAKPDVAPSLAFFALLGGWAHIDPKRWASLRSHFGVLAEAAPDLFLSRIEDDLKSSAPALPQLFREQSGSMFGGWLHCELLWALEVLSWSPEYGAALASIPRRWNKKASDLPAGGRRLPVFPVSTGKRFQNSGVNLPMLGD